MALPSHLSAAPFLVSSALDDGLSRDRLDGADLLRPFRGIRATASAAPSRLYAPRLRPGERFSHSTAAELWGAPLPRRHENAVHVSGPHARVRMRGVVGHESDGGMTLRMGLPVSTVDEMFLELASLLSVHELVAVGDHLVHVPRRNDIADWRPSTTIERLRQAP